MLLVTTTHRSIVLPRSKFINMLAGHINAVAKTLTYNIANGLFTIVYRLPSCLNKTGGAGGAYITVVF